MFISHKIKAAKLGHILNMFLNVASGLLQKYYQETNEQCVDTSVQESLKGRTNEIGNDVQTHIKKTRL